MPLSREQLAQLDREDALAPLRDEFVLPEGVIYLDGNSLGAMPAHAPARIHEVMTQQWGHDLVRSWNVHDWFAMPHRLGARIAPLIGARDDEVVVTDSTGINLFKLIAMALRLRPLRKVIVMEEDNFPTDTYIAQGLAALLDAGHQIRFAGREDITSAITDDVALVALTHVHYKTGAFFDMPAITAQAHAAGALMCWDLCHSAGAMALDLNGAEADFAVGCGYKYLNGGPGAPAFAFVAQRHQGQAEQPLTGWWSHAEPFAFARDYRPAKGINQMLSGTQSVLAMAALECGIDIMTRADMDLVRQKSMALGDAFAALMEDQCAGHGFTLASPRDPAARASQIAYRHEHGYAIVQALIEVGVVGDFRAPDIIRFGLTPLYTRYTDIWDAVQAIRTVMEEKLWQAPRFSRRDTVT